MRVLLVSDLHYSLPQLDWVVEASSSYDVVAVVGDSLNISSAVPLEAQSIVVSRYLEEIASRAQFVVSSGNHDLTGPDEHGEQTALWLSHVRGMGIPTDGDSVLVDNTLLQSAHGGTVPKAAPRWRCNFKPMPRRRPARPGVALPLAATGIADLLDGPP